MAGIDFDQAVGAEVMESSPISSIVWLTEGLARFEPFGTVAASFT
jgi:hypothetical protein